MLHLSVAFKEGEWSEAQHVLGTILQLMTEEVLSRHYTVELREETGRLDILFKDVDVPVPESLSRWLKQHPCIAAWDTISVPTSESTVWEQVMVRLTNQKLDVVRENDMGGQAYLLSGDLLMGIYMTLVIQPWGYATLTSVGSNPDATSTIQRIGLGPLEADQFVSAWIQHRMRKVEARKQSAREHIDVRESEHPF